jgi:hypothetical protein
MITTWAVVGRGFFVPKSTTDPTRKPKHNHEYTNWRTNAEGASDLFWTVLRHQGLLRKRAWESLVCIVGLERGTEEVARGN